MARWAAAQAAVFCTQGLPGVQSSDRPQHAGQLLPLQVGLTQHLYPALAAALLVLVLVLLFSHGSRVASRHIATPIMPLSGFLPGVDPSSTADMLTRIDVTSLPAQKSRLQSAG